MANEIDASSEDKKPWSQSAATLMVAFLFAIWVIEVLDSLIFGDRLQGGGIRPRDAGGLDGILWAPFLHSGWGHLISNTLPFAVLGGLVAIRGRSRWVNITVIVALVGGILTWVFGSGGNHIGASGIVFGYFGALVGAAFFERRPAAMAPALVAIMLYSGLIAGFVPQAGISWEGHLFGFLAGLLGAKLLVEPDRRRADPDDGVFDPDDFAWE